MESGGLHLALGLGCRVASLSLLCRADPLARSRVAGQMGDHETKWAARLRMMRAGCRVQGGMAGRCGRGKLQWAGDWTAQLADCQWAVGEHPTPPSSAVERRLHLLTLVRCSFRLVTALHNLSQTMPCRTVIGAHTTQTKSFGATGSRVARLAKKPLFRTARLVWPTFSPMGWRGWGPACPAHILLQIHLRRMMNLNLPEPHVPSVPPPNYHHD